MRQSDSVTLGSGTMVTLVGMLLAAGLWLGVLQAQVTGLKSQAADAQNGHAAIMTKLEEIQNDLVALRVALTKETAEQNLLHKGQVPAR